jgi:hypothetical protein
MQGLSLSDVMFVTKHNMANAVQSMSKQLEQVSSALAVCSVPNFISIYFSICHLYKRN